MKWSIMLIVAVSAAVLCSVALIPCCGGEQKHVSMIAGIQQIGKVNVLYAGVAEVMTLSSKSGKSQMMWLVYGGGFYQIDLSKMRFYSEAGKDVVEVSLPEVYAVANMKKSRPYKTSVALGYTDKAINKMWGKVAGEANKIVAKAARSADNMKIAKDQAENVIRQMIGSPIEVRWRQ